MAWCVFMGCARVSTANASMADALAPLLIFALAAFHTRRVTVLQTLGVLFGFTGALLVIGVVDRNGLALSAYSTGDLCVRPQRRSAERTAPPARCRPRA